MSDTPPPAHNPSLTHTIIGESTGVIKRLDPNMLAMLLLTVILNGLFFYTYVKIAESRHVEFMAALNSCPSTTR